ncbi:DUF4142 domain-containing protein [Rhizobium sp. CC-YZS058]|uniref:DUF4142 domain-containing protein n=1 Tax=Rhizobium sp. CC-YZS058 TaxID=3042153 RepID=UPI002B05492D|nr:DUF4142 domain-containing protein [Rhizobium sp. CC-YZS058]MEA3534554.1 DUF4142 domain-containing protein [Rhizobium sp. CC-YZS058]
MKTLFLTTASAALVSAALLASPVLAQSAAEKTGVNSVLGVAPKTEDFIKEAAASDMFEIESSKLALERGDERTKAYAQQMINDHQKTSSELKDLATKAGLQMPAPQLSSAQQGMLDELKESDGEEFSDDYQEDQVTAHESAVDLFTRYGNEGEQAELKAWAAKTRPALEHHLMMARELDKD